jgi:hypothetical protein
MTFVNNISKNVANLLWQNEIDDQLNNRIRVKVTDEGIGRRLKVERGSTKQIGNVLGGPYDSQIRPSSQ